MLYQYFRKVVDGWVTDGQGRGWILMAYVELVLGQTLHSSGPGWVVQGSG